MIRICLLAFILLGCDESSNNAATLGTDAGAADQTTSDATPIDSDLTDSGSADLDSGDTNVGSTDIGDLDHGHSDSLVSPESDFGQEPQADGGGPEPTIWTGPRLTFTKISEADPTTPEAQDFITENVILTRGDRNSLYNIARESTANPSVSPIGTLWAMGTTADLDNLDFKSLKQAANNRMRQIQGRDMVLFLVDDNIYIDLRFRSWSGGHNGGGGGFSYERTTPAEN